MLKNKCDFQHIVQSSLFSKTPLERGKRVCCVFHASIRRQELWNPHQPSHIETLGKNHRVIVLVAKAKRKVSCFFYFCQFQRQALACRSQDFKKVFPANNCFHVCILIANSGSLLTMSFLHCVQEPFFVWKSSEFPLNGNQGPSWHLSKNPSLLIHCGASLAKMHWEVKSIWVKAMKSDWLWAFTFLIESFSIPFCNLSTWKLSKDPHPVADNGE